MSPKEFSIYMEYCLSLGFKTTPDYRWLLKQIENVATRERIDLHDGCFDWNLLKASQYLYTDPIQKQSR